MKHQESKFLSSLINFQDSEQKYYYASVLNLLSQVVHLDFI